VTFGQQLAAKHGVRVACFGHAGDGNIHVNLLVNLVPNEPGEVSGSCRRGSG
jgi:FAD/FMN-containing dehydrogenase